MAIVWCEKQLSLVKKESGREGSDKDGWPEKWVAGDQCWLAVAGSRISERQMEILGFWREEEDISLGSVWEHRIHLKIGNLNLVFKFKNCK